MVNPQPQSPPHPFLDRSAGASRVPITDIVGARHGGLLPAGALLEVGISRRGIQQLCADGVLTSIRRGVYVTAECWRNAGADERYRLLVRATVLVAERPPVLSHQSAAVLHGLPIIGPWPARVHTSTPDAGGGSSTRAIISHRGAPPAAPQVIDGCQVTSLARTLVDVAATSSMLVAVTMLDHALRTELECAERDQARRGDLTKAPARQPLTTADLYRELAEVNPRTGRYQAERAIAFANPLSANPGETLSRVRIFQLGFEAPELQVCFPDILGRNAYVDFWWGRVRKIGEFDGFLKYGAGAVGDRDPGTVVWQEKQREDALRARVRSFDRWGWELALSPNRFHAFLTERGVPRA